MKRRSLTFSVASLITVGSMRVLYTMIFRSATFSGIDSDMVGTGTVTTVCAAIHLHPYLNSVGGLICGL